MTWLKLSDDFDLELGQVGLSAEGFRLHVQGLLYVMRKETGGTLTHREVLRYVSDADEPLAAVAELVGHGFWRATETGWAIVHGMTDQPTPEQIAAQRANTAERQARLRAKRMGVQTGADDRSNGVTNGVSNGVTRRVTSGRDGTGRDGAGLSTEPRSENQAHEHTHEPAREALVCSVESCGWPVVSGSLTCVDHSGADLDWSPDDAESEELPEFGWSATS